MVCSGVGEGRVRTAVQSVFCTEQLCKVYFARNFTWSQRAEYPFESVEIPFNGKGSNRGRPSVSDAPLDRLRDCFHSRPQTSKRRGSFDFHLLKNDVSKSLRKRLLVKNKIFNWSRHWKQDLEVRYELCREMLARTENDKDLPAKFTSVTRRRILTSKRKLIGILSVFG
jgi:hypothetical protein